MVREEKRRLWERRIKNYQSSGLTAAEWCEKNGVNCNTLKTMITRLGMTQRKNNKSISPKGDVQWIGIKNHETEREEVVKDPSFVVVLGQAKIKISPGFDKKTIRELVKILNLSLTVHR